MQAQGSLLKTAGFDDRTEGFSLFGIKIQALRPQIK
jgi:hypothetical protein